MRCALVSKNYVPEGQARARSTSAEHEHGDSDDGGYEVPGGSGNDYAGVDYGAAITAADYYGEPLTRNPYLKKAEFKWLSTTHTILNAEGDLKFQVYTQRKDLEEFRPPPQPMKLGPCLAAFGVGEQLETFTEADVFTVEQARKLSQLQLVLLGVPEDDCPRLLEHIAGWEGDAEEAAKKKKLEKEAKKRAKLKEKLRAGEEGGSGDEGSVSSDGTSSSSSDDDD